MSCRYSGGCRSFGSTGTRVGTRGIAAGSGDVRHGRSLDRAGVFGRLVEWLARRRGRWRRRGLLQRRCRGDRLVRKDACQAVKLGVTVLLVAIQSRLWIRLSFAELVSKAPLSKTSLQATGRI